MENFSKLFTEWKNWVIAGLAMLVAHLQGWLDVLTSFGG